jgi:hypothetical protein
MVLHGQEIGVETPYFTSVFKDFQGAAEKLIYSIWRKLKQHSYTHYRIL